MHVVMLRDIWCIGYIKNYIILAFLLDNKIFNECRLYTRIAGLGLVLKNFNGHFATDLLQLGTNNGLKSRLDMKNNRKCITMSLSSTWSHCFVDIEANLESVYSTLLTNSYHWFPILYNTRFNYIEDLLTMNFASL